MKIIAITIVALIIISAGILWLFWPENEPSELDDWEDPDEPNLPCSRVDEARHDRARADATNRRRSF